LNPLRRSIFLVIFILSLSSFAAQVGGQSLGDIARQERARRLAEADAKDTDGLKEAPFHANILLVDSKSAAEKWVLMPAADKPGAGRMRQVGAGEKIYVPFVVTDYPFPATEKMDLTVHIRFLSPEGKVLLEKPDFSETIAPDPKSPHLIVLNPVTEITFDSHDLPGTYTFRLTIVDHVHSTYAKAEEKIELIQGKTGTGDASKSSAAMPASGDR
jgi:hypothetical protein